MVIKLRVALTLIGLVAILLAIHFLTSGSGQSGRIRIPVARSNSTQTPAASSGLNAAVPAAQENVKYGLLVGQYAVESEAQAMALRADGTAFKVADAAGRSWWATIVGPYGSVKDARDHSNDVAARLKTPALQMPIVKWPQTAR